MTMDRPGQILFLNVDLDVESPFDLAPLVEALGERVSNLYTGPATAGFATHLELSGDLVMPATADIAIRGFVTLLTSLPQSARELWDRATRKEFNIGIQAGTNPPAFEAHLEPATIANVARLGATIGLTIYAFDGKSTARVDRRRASR
jgi:hypothetical protein